MNSIKTIKNIKMIKNKLTIRKIFISYNSNNNSSIIIKSNNIYNKNHINQLHNSRNNINIINN